MTAPRLHTRYLGLDLRGPVIASAGPRTGDVDGLLALQDAGVAAVVLPSLFEEDVRDDDLDRPDDADSGEEFAEFRSSPLPADLPGTDVGHHLSLVEDAKRALEIPVIASVNATHHGPWERYAAMMVDAGADAIELNLYTVGADPDTSGADLEAQHLDVVAAVKESIDVPLAVRLSPYYSSLAHFAQRVVDHGADALVLFNRFYAPDIDVSARAVVPTVELSTSSALRLPLRWTSILRGQQPEVSLACSSGVHEAQDVIKALLAGADVACTTSAILRRDHRVVGELLASLRAWLADHGFDSVEAMRGTVCGVAADAAAYERSQYRAVITAAHDRYR